MALVSSEVPSSQHVPDAACQEFIQHLAQSAFALLAAKGAVPEPGPVSLVGAGPGDPELLTVRALRRLQAAEVILHDSLVTEELLRLAPPSAALIDVGKRCGDAKDRGLQQQEIHELLLSHCRAGRRVVRLKCGDPMLFGRGGEELEFLAQHGIEAEVVPGITSATGASAACRLPLTHRGMSNEVRFVVGQDRGKSLPDLDWAELATRAQRQTVVFYMGGRSLEAICSCLGEHGAESQTPMALLEAVTHKEEQRLYGTLGTLPQLAQERSVGGGPVLIILGPTVAFPDYLHQLCMASQVSHSDISADVVPAPSTA